MLANISYPNKVAFLHSSYLFFLPAVHLLAVLAYILLCQYTLLLKRFLGVSSFPAIFPPFSISQSILSLSISSLSLSLISLTIHMKHVVCCQGNRLKSSLIMNMHYFPSSALIKLPVTAEVYTTESVETYCRTIDAVKKRKFVFGN